MYFIYLDIWGGGGGGVGGGGGGGGGGGWRGVGGVPRVRYQLLLNTKTKRSYEVSRLRLARGQGCAVEFFRLELHPIQARPFCLPKNRRTVSALPQVSRASLYDRTTTFISSRKLGPSAQNAADGRTAIACGASLKSEAFDAIRTWQRESFVNPQRLSATCLDPRSQSHR
jgi:hypothetical protein